MEYTCIEMCGLPGSGKTTLLKSLDEKQIESFRTEEDFYRQIRTAQGRALTFFYCFSAHFFEDLSLLFSLLRFADGSRAGVIKKFFKLLRFKGILGRRKENFLLSEGYVQAFLEIMDGLDHDAWEKGKEIKEYFAADVKRMNSSCYVIFDTPVETAMRRISKRNDANNSIDRMQEEKRAELIRKRFDNTEKVKKCIIETKKPDQVLIIDPNNSLSENIQVLDDFIGRVCMQ